jgi:hypothetical protein
VVYHLALVHCPLKFAQQELSLEQDPVVFEVTQDSELEYAGVVAVAVAVVAVAVAVAVVAYGASYAAVVDTHKDRVEDKHSVQEP